jgi:galactokinase
VDKHIFFALRKNKDRICRFVAHDIGEEAEVDLRNIERSDKLWVNYLAGILQQFQKDDAVVEGVDCAFGGDLPIGAGMSSSAALECGFAYGLNRLLTLRYSRINIAQLAQQSSHQFVGVQCGIMDQFTSLMGKKDNLILLDCESLDYEYIPFRLPGYRIVLLNSKVHHELSSSEYGLRVEECRRGVEILSKYYPTIDSLRDADLDKLEAHREELGDVVFRRCAYVVEENQRVLEACEMLREGAIEDLGQLMFQTHDGLRDQYEVSCPEIDFLVDLARDYKGVAGARVMGGGFGGSTINLVREETAGAFMESSLQAYREQFGIEGEGYVVDVVDGTGVVSE